MREDFFWYLPFSSKRMGAEGGGVMDSVGGESYGQFPFPSRRAVEGGETSTRILHFHAGKGERGRRRGPGIDRRFTFFPKETERGVPNYMGEGSDWYLSFLVGKREGIKPGRFDGQGSLWAFTISPEERAWGTREWRRGAEIGW